MRLAELTRLTALACPGADRVGSLLTSVLLLRDEIHTRRTQHRIGGAGGSGQGVRVGQRDQNM